MINNLKREIANVVIFLYKDSAGDESSDRWTKKHLTVGETLFTCVHDNSNEAPVDEKSQLPVVYVCV